MPIQGFPSTYRVANTGAPPVISTVPLSHQTFSYPGTYKWMRPPGCVAVYVECVGGGGGGAGYSEAGGAGGYAAGYFWLDGDPDPATASNLYVVATVGGAGGNVTYYTTGGDGGTTSFGSYISASGGYGANRNHQHTGGTGGIGSSTQIAFRGGGGSGHNNPSTTSYSTGTGHGGDSFYGGSSFCLRRDGAINNAWWNGKKNQTGAPGAGGPGGETDLSSAGAPGEYGLIVVHEFFSSQDTHGKWW